MSIATVQQFWQKARNDPALQAKLQASASAHQEKAIAAVVGIAAAAGFVFTAAEYEAALKEERPGSTPPASSGTSYWRG
jgi:predicted ribosomally synthesized peptide with nif11-like leader